MGITAGYTFLDGEEKQSKKLNLAFSGATAFSGTSLSVTGAQTATGLVSINSNSGAMATAPFSAGLILQGADATANYLGMMTFAQSAVIQANRANGTNAAKTATTTNDNILQIMAGGYETVTPAYSTQRALIQFIATEPWTNAAQGTKIVMRTCTAGTVTNVTVATIDSTGLALVGLMDISGATSGQVKFPATQNPSANVNTLDDYEEGTWTPVVGGTATYTVQTGTYTKIGNTVTLTFNLQINVIGTGATGTITGLPFNSAVISSGVIGFWGGLALAPVFLACYINGGNLVLTGAVAAAANITNAIAVLGNGANVIGSVTYPAT